MSYLIIPGYFPRQPCYNPLQQGYALGTGENSHIVGGMYIEGVEVVEALGASENYWIVGLKEMGIAL